jgi:CHASE2 domain-containing sensor protein
MGSSIVQRESFSLRWWKHTLTSITFGLIFFLLLQPFEETSIFRVLDHWGADAVMQVYSAMPDAHGPPVVVVDIGEDPKLAELAMTMAQIRDAHPKAVGLDIVASNDDRNDPAINDMLAVLSDDRWQGTPVALPVQNHRGFDDAVAMSARLRRASADLVMDEDGVVRTTSACVTAGTARGEETLPTLAAAVANDRLHSTADCPQELGSRPILFTRPQVPSDDPDWHDHAAPGVFLISADAIGQFRSLLAAAYVLVGHAGPQSTADAYMTPLRPGAMPGVLIHANAVRTMRLNIQPHWLLAHKWALDLFIALMIGSALAGYTAACDVFLERLHQIYWKAIATFLLSGLLALLLVGGLLAAVCILWTWFASGLVGQGLLIGALVPAFGAMLETLAHVGEALVLPVEFAVSRVVSNRHG